MFFEKKWRFKTVGTEGNCIVFGVDIFKYKWTDTGEDITVLDPLYHQSHTFSVYTAVIREKTRKFATGEFSNNVWGFYV